MREGESTSDKNKDQEPAAAGKRTRACQRQHLSRPRSRVCRVLKSTVKRPPATKPVGGQGQRQHLSSRRLPMPTLLDGQQSPTSVFCRLSPLCAAREPAHNGARGPKTDVGDTYGNGGATLPFSVDLLFFPVTQKTTVEPLDGGDRRLVQNSIL